jgi:creatinine amidohydrolase
MKIREMNWMQVEEYLKRDDRAILPLGSVEQHGYLSLCTDVLLAEKIAEDAAEPLGIPVFPVLPYGITPHLMAYPGTMTLKVSLYLDVVKNLLENMVKTGFRRILVVNGHGGNTPVCEITSEVMAKYPETRIKFHSWWNAPKTWAKVLEIDPDATHASWMENFPWTRLAGLKLPKKAKPMCDADAMQLLNGKELRKALGDGNYGGLYERSDKELLSIWKIAVSEARELLENNW